MFLRIGGKGIGMVVALTGAFSCFIFALLHTTVANAAFTIGLAPVFAAASCWPPWRGRASQPSGQPGCGRGNGIQPGVRAQLASSHLVRSIARVVCRAV